MQYLSQVHEEAVEKLKAGTYDQALVLINEALQINKKHPVLLAERGTIYMYLKQKENALEDMDLALYLEPEKPYRFSSRGYIKSFFGDIEGAIEDYEKCLALDPQDIITMNNLGLMIEKKGNLKKAQYYFKKTDELLERNPDWQSRIASDETSESPLSENRAVENEISKQNQAATQKNSVASVAKDVFTKKSVFQEFFQFIRNGFKLKS